MRKGRLSQDELQKRCDEVFCSNDGDEYYDILITDDGRVIVNMSELAEPEEWGEHRYCFDYAPDMSERPEALAYLMGYRDDFND